jgi:hypothetical protein
MVSRFSDATYETIIANSPDGILLVHQRSMIVLAND